MIVPFAPEYAPYFESLNREWLERYFRVEPKDETYFRDPAGTILAAGGQIFFLLEEGVLVGTAAALRHDTDHFELGKMAVTAKVQGKGYGRQLAEAVIRFAIESGGTRMTVISDTKLPAAVHLYERLGFQHAPLPEATGYARGDVFMVMELNTS